MDYATGAGAWKESPDAPVLAGGTIPAALGRALSSGAFRSALLRPWNRYWRQLCRRSRRDAGLEVVKLLECRFGPAGIGEWLPAEIPPGLDWHWRLGGGFTCRKAGLAGADAAIS